MPERPIERLWESGAFAAQFLRASLAPASWLYDAGVRARNAAYDRGWLPSHALGLPTVSVGNLTVGGTGKTPMASWFARRVLAEGGRPAVLLRGYGADEPQVHRALAPGAIVLAGGDRARTAEVARSAGATALVLDDGFQHRSVRRDADVALLSADRKGTARLLPAGPWREGERSLRRATHLVVTRKQVTLADARLVAVAAARVAPAAQVAIVHLAPGELVRWRDHARAGLVELAGRSVLAVSGIGDPRSFEAAMCDTGATVTPRTYADHHAFSGHQVVGLAREAERVEYVVCTLKDAVKLGPIWPPSAPPLWYLSQDVRIEFGAEALEEIISRLAGHTHD